MNDLMIIKEQTMSSTAIAKLTGKLHKNVMRDICKMLNGFEIDGVYLSSYTNSRGKKYAKYDLVYKQAKKLLSGYSSLTAASKLKCFKVNVEDISVKRVSI